MATRLEQAQQALQNPNVRAFLDMLAAAEGTVQHGYATAFGGAKLPALNDHPRTQTGFTQTDGKRNTTSAAGRYQFLEDTWDDVAGKLKLPDFGPQSQDIAAVELLNRAGALQAVLSGDFDTAVQKSGATWASLPSSPYPQSKRSMDFIRAQLPPNLIQGVTPMPDPIPNQIPDPIPNPITLPPVWASQLPTTTTPAPAAPMVPATQPGAIGAVMAALRPQQVAPIEAEPVFTAEDDAMLAQGLAADVSTQRGQAVAKFFGEEYMPDIPLPDALDASISRYLALI